MANDMKNADERPTCQMGVIAAQTGKRKAERVWMCAGRWRTRTRGGFCMSSMNELRAEVDAILQSKEALVNPHQLLAIRVLHKLWTCRRLDLCRGAANVTFTAHETDLIEDVLLECMLGLIDQN
jgi:hypothetical protein